MHSHSTFNFKRCQPPLPDNQKFFIKDCIAFTREITTSHFSPWKETASVLPYWHKHGQKSFGKIQRQILNHFTEHFFSRSLPVYLKADNIARRIGSTRSQVVHSISALVNRGILIRAHFMHRQCNRTMLLPSMVEVKDAIDILLPDKKNDSKSKTSHPSLAPLFQRLSKSLAKKSALVYAKINFILFNLRNNFPLSSNPCSIETNSFIKLGRAPLIIPQDGQPITLEEQLMNLSETSRDLLLRRMQKPVTIPETYRDIFKTLAQHSYSPSCLTPQDLSSLGTYLQHNYGIDPKAHWRSLLSDKYRTTHLEQIALFQRLCWLAHRMIKLNPIIAVHVADYWNKKIEEESPSPEKIFSQVRTNPDSKKYIDLSVTITHALHNLCNGTPSKMTDMIDRLHEFGPEVYRFRRIRPFDIVKFFSDPFEMGYLPAFAAPTEKVKIELYRWSNAKNLEIQPDHRRSFNRMREIYVNTLYPTNTKYGQEQFYNYEYLMVEFFKYLVDKIEKREMCDRKLFFPGGVYESSGYNPVWFEYLFWLSTYLNKTPLINDIIYRTNWENFVKFYMRGEMGASDFWFMKKPLDKMKNKI